MSRNRGVVYTKPGKVQVQNIADPKFENPQCGKIEHRVIGRPSYASNRQLMMGLLNDRLPIVKIINYTEFDKGMAAKFVLDPYGVLATPT